MVKKICIALSIASLLPLHGAMAAKKRGPKADRELIEMEDRLDREADQLIGRVSDNDGEELILGIIGVIGELASRNERGHGQGGWHPGYGRHHRKIKCVARNANGRRFRAEGYVAHRVARRALKACKQLTRMPRVKRTCRVVRCR